MLWIDFSLICIGQEKSSIPSEIKIDIEAYLRNVDSSPFYNENYNFYTADKLMGCWYNIWLDESVCFDESFFDIAADDIPYVNVIPKYENTVKNILEFYINESPEHKIAVLLRVQDDSNDTVHPSCTVDEFISLLNKGRIKWNELYFIHK